MNKPRFAISLLAALSVSSLQAGELTIYNQNYALVKENRTLSLKAGDNAVRFTDVTAHVEPDSVILRNPQKPDSLRILEQNYEGEPLSETLLLKKYEGKTIKFEISAANPKDNKIVEGKIIRSAYVPHYEAYNQYGGVYAMAQNMYASGGGGQPIVEIDGGITFGLPGRPLFDKLDPESFLKPTLLWKLWSAQSGSQDVEVSYLTGGMSWEATYNVVAPEKGDVVDLVGWVTLNNMSGKDFPDAKIKLMAGDVARAPQTGVASELGLSKSARLEGYKQEPSATERSFDEYHLYTLTRPTDVLDREIKQVEFVRANRVPTQRVYVYDGFQETRYSGWDYNSIRNQPDYGTLCNKKVWAMLEFENSEKKGMGMPLPRGKIKIYRQDIDGRREFVGEDAIDHTPKDEKVRIYTGNAFDLVGERKQTNYQLDTQAKWADETFEIVVRNHKDTPVEIRVVEHLYRWNQWSVKQISQAYKKKDAQTLEFPVTVAPNGSQTITYTVHYSW